MPRALPSLALFAAAAAGGAYVAASPAPAAAQMLKQCVTGMKVVDEAGTVGVITSADGAYCNIRLANGASTMRMYFVLRPAAAANQPANAPLRAGEYDCAVSSGYFSHPNVVPMGRFDIRGGSYRFRPFGKVTQGFAPYTIGGDGSLHWGGRMGGLDIPPSVLVRSYKTPQGFNVVYRVKNGTDADTMSCHPV